MAVFLISAALDIFQTLIVELDTEGRYLFLNAVANQLRYPNTHTHYFSFVLLYLYAQSNQVSDSFWPFDLTSVVYIGALCMYVGCIFITLNGYSQLVDVLYFTVDLTWNSHSLRVWLCDTHLSIWILDIFSDCVGALSGHCKTFLSCPVIEEETLFWFRIYPMYKVEKSLLLEYWAVLGFCRK